MRNSTMFLIAMTAAAALSGCGDAPAPAASSPAQASGDGKAYLRSPAVREALRQGDAVMLSGVAPAGAQVRLASPLGGAVEVTANEEGDWNLMTPAPLTAAIFGLSALADGRRLQAEGYLLVAPRGPAAVLRGGAGAVRLDKLADTAIGAVDFDGGRQTVISGLAPSGATVSISLDGRRVAEGRADQVGRFSISLPQPTPPGAHRIEARGAGFAAVASFTLSAAAPLTEGPLRSEIGPEGLRADWLTPGGGVQSTILIGRVQ